MSRFTAYAFNPMSGARIGEVPYETLNWSDGLRGVGSGSISVPWWHESASLIVPNAAGIAFDDGGELRWSGWVTTRDLNPEESTVKFGLRSWWDYYTRRWIRSTFGMSHTGAPGGNVGPYDIVFTAQDQFDIVDDLLAHAAAVAGDANLGLTVRMLGPGVGGLSGVTRTRTYYSYERKRIAQCVEDLSDQQGGFDFAVVSAWNTATNPYLVTRYLDLNYPRRGASASGIVLEHGTNVAILRVVTDGEQMANPMVAVGAGTGDAALTYEAVDLSYLYPLPGQYPYLEGEVQYRDEGAEYSGNLGRLATGNLAATKQPIETATVGIVEHGGTQLGDIGIGDTVRMVATFGAFTIDGWYRVVQQSVSVDTGGLREWTIDLADNDATLRIV